VKEPPDKLKEREDLRKSGSGRGRGSHALRSIRRGRRTFLGQALQYSVNREGDASLIIGGGRAILNNGLHLAGTLRENEIGTLSPHFLKKRKKTYIAVFKRKGAIPQEQRTKKNKTEGVLKYSYVIVGSNEEALEFMSAAGCACRKSPKRDKLKRKGGERGVG